MNKENFYQSFVDNRRVKFGLQICPPTRIDLINYLRKINNAKSYLEIGCRSDKCFNKIKIKNKVGIDPERGGTLRMTSDEYFQKHNEKFDIIFIDGLHLYEQVVIDLNNSLNCLNENGFIILHDLLPTAESRAGEQPAKAKSGGWNGTTWKISWDLIDRDDVIFNIGLFDEGVGIVQKNEFIPTDSINIEPKSKNIDYKYYEKNKLDLPFYTWNELIEIYKINGEKK